VSKLLRLGAKVDSTAEFNMTPLHMCAMHKQHECCALLLQHTTTSSPLQEMLNNLSLSCAPSPVHATANRSALLSSSSSSSFNKYHQNHVISPRSPSSPQGMEATDSYCGIKVSNLALLGTLLSGLTKSKRTALHCAIRNNDALMVQMLLEAVGNCGGCEALSKFVSSKPSTPNTATNRTIPPPVSSNTTSANDHHIPTATTTATAASSTTSPSVPPSSAARRKEYASNTLGRHSSFIDYDNMDAEELKLTKTNEKKKVEEEGRRGALYCFANTVDDQGFSVLHDAAKRGNIDIVRSLLEAGSRPELKTKGSNRTATEVALEYGHIQVAELINQYAAICGTTDWASGRLRGMYDTEVKTTSEKWHFLS
jgi:ankyrin repeat protein